MTGPWPPFGTIPRLDRGIAFAIMTDNSGVDGADSESPQTMSSAVARKYLTLHHIQIVAVGDVTKIKPILEKYGKLTIYDVEGKVVQ